MILWDIARKDLLRLLRDRKTFLFMLLMPAVFTLLMGYAFGGFSRGSDSRLPVGWLDQDHSPVSRDLRRLIEASDAVRLVDQAAQAEMGAQVADGDLAAGLLVAPGFGDEMKKGHRVQLIFVGDPGTPAGMSVESEAAAALIHIESALRAAAALEDHAGLGFDHAYSRVLTAWDDPPVQLVETQSAASREATGGAAVMASMSPGMMLQFAIGGLLVSAQIMVNERKTRCLARMLTTAARRRHILGGHFLAVFVLTCAQFILLIAYGQLLLGVNYLHAPAATALIALAAVVFVSGYGLLIGVVAKTEEQAVILSLASMFLLTGFGGAWVPLELVGDTFRRIAHLTPLAWGMDGFKAITVRGLGLEAVLLPAAVLLAYGAVCCWLAAWRFERLQEK